MKKFLTLIFSVWLFAAMAQQKDTAFPFLNGRTSFGIKIGFTQANLYGTDIKALSVTGNTSPQNGFHAGLTINSMIGKYFWLKHELLYTQKGAGITLNDSLNGNYSSKLKTQYLDLFPINLTFHFKGFQIYAGPYAAVLLAASIQRKNAGGAIYTDKSIYGDGTQFENKSKYLQKLDYGFNAGIEYEFKFGFNIGAKLVRGYASLIQYANSHTFNDPKTNYDLHNMSFNISIGYSFRKKR